MDRTKVIVRTGIVGIIANIILAGFKAFVGILSNSVAITMDAVNNLSDAMSSIITIIGAKLSAKEPDRKHPFGYGRIEYMSAMVIGVIIFYAGITSLIESVKKIIHPEAPDYGVPALIIVASAIVVKIALGLYTKKVGEKVNSDSLVASGKDALNDSVISAATLVAAIIFIVTDFSIEAYLGVVIAFIILKAGFETLKETISEILGERITPELAKDIKHTIRSIDGVMGVYDLIVHNYGSEKWMGSAHIEVPDTTDAVEIDKLGREVAKKVFLEKGITMTGISIYSINTKDEKAREGYAKMKELIKDYPDVLQLHGFYLNSETKEIRFDIVINIEAKNKKETYCSVLERAKAMYPDYDVEINIDYNFAD